MISWLPLMERKRSVIHSIMCSKLSQTSDAWNMLLNFNFIQFCIWNKKAHCYGQRISLKNFPIKNFIVYWNFVVKNKLPFYLFCYHFHINHSAMWHKSPDGVVFNPLAPKAADRCGRESFMHLTMLCSSGTGTGDVRDSLDMLPYLCIICLRQCNVSCADRKNYQEYTNNNYEASGFIQHTYNF